MTKTDLTNLALAKIGERGIATLDDPNDKNARHAALHFPQVRDELLRAHFWSFALTVARLEAEVPVDAMDRLVSGISAEWAWIPPGGVLRYSYYGEEGGKPSYGFGGNGFSWYPGDEEFPGRWLIRVDGSTLFESTEDTTYPEQVQVWTPMEGATGAPVIRTMLDEERGEYRYAFALPADFLKLEKLAGDEGRVDSFRLQRVSGKRCVLADAERPRLHYVSRRDDPAEYDPLFTAAFATLLASRLARGITGSEQLEQSLLQRYEQVDLPAARTADSHDSQSAENHPLEEILGSSLTGRRR